MKIQEISTLLDLVYLQAKSFDNKLFLNYKKNDKLISFSNQEFLDNAFYFSCGLREIGFQNGDVLANISYQNPIWLIADFGAMLSLGVTVPIFHNISKENLLYEISDAKVGYIFTDNLEFFELISKENLNLKIITFGFKKENSVDFEDLILLGKKAAAERKYIIEDILKLCKEDDLATIIYTSGSTGRPKGVEITHKNLVSQIKSTVKTFPLNKNFDVALSFLPLAHIFERMVMMFYMSQGISIYFADDIKNMSNSLKEFRPSLMTVVPRVLEKVFISVKDSANNGSFFKKFLAKKAINYAMEKPSESKNSFLGKVFDLLVYKKIRQNLGGNIKMIICGGAALSRDLEIFYKNIGLTIFCGYGLTESSPVLAVNFAGANKIGTVGKAFFGVELKISNDGELLAKGENIMRGYHNQKEKTLETMDGEWLKTGDLAQIDEDGFVKITGRKKELFKTANGKYVAPVPIEQKLVQNLGFLIGAIIIAEARKFTSVLLFPDFDIIEKTKKNFGFSGENEEFLKSNILQEFVEKEIAKINKDLNHWEQIQKFEIYKKPISIESGEITPSMKLKRSILEEKNKDIIDSFYS